MAMRWGRESVSDGSANQRDGGGNRRLGSVGSHGITDNLTSGCREAAQSPAGARQPNELRGTD
eukprot:5184128-Prymnesium_polylepis.1